MKLFFKLFAVILALLVVALAGLAWWLWRADSMEPPALAGVVESGSLQHGGHRRSWQAFIPERRTEPAPVVLVLHGSRGDGQRMLESTRYGFTLLAEREGFIPVYPDGFEQHWNDCRAGAAYSANVQDIDDVGFLLSLVDTLALEHPVDLSRIYVVGMSNGAQMAYRMGLEAAGRVAGIAAIAANLPVAENLDCESPGQPVQTLIVNGTDDPINPYAGGVVRVGKDASRGSVRSAHESAAFWARLAGYPGEGERRVWADRSPGDSTTVESLSWSAAGRPSVSLVTVVGGGHTIPHTRYRQPPILGRTSHEFDTAELVWTFFSSGSLYRADGFSPVGE